MDVPQSRFWRSSREFNTEHFVNVDLRDRYFNPSILRNEWDRCASLQQSYGYCAARDANPDVYIVYEAIRDVPIAHVGYKMKQYATLARHAMRDDAWHIVHLIGLFIADQGREKRAKEI
jgi:hypothetical protein